MRKILLNILLLFLLFSTNTYAKKIQQDPALTKGKLSNGLTYYIYPNTKTEGEAIYRLFIKSGSILEEENQRGLAHFLEHMAFNGTENFPDDGIIKYLQSIGAKFGKDLNAHTSFNETVYKLNLPATSKGKVDSAILILSDWAGRLTLSSDKIEKERGIIISEWLSKQGPEYEAKLAFTNEILGTSRYASRMTIGDTSIIKNFKDQELIDYYHKWYNPALMAVAVVGDITPKEVEKQIKKCFGDFVSQPIETYKTYGIDSYEDVSFRIVKDSSFNKTLFEILKVMPPLDPVVEESDYHKYLEKNIVSTLLKNRLTDLFYSSKPYFSAGMSISGFLNVSQIFYGKVELNPQKTDNGIDSYLKTLNQIMTYGFTEDEIKKAKNKYAGILYSRSNAKNDRDSQKILDEIYNDFYSGHRIITASTEYKLFKKYADKIDSKSIMNYLKKINSYNSHYLLTTFQEELSNYNIDSIVTASLNEEVTPYEKKVNTPKELIKDFNKKGSVIRREKIAEIDADVLSLSNGAKIIYKQSDNDKDNTQISGFRKGGLFALDSANYINGLYCTSILSACGVGQYTREELDFYLTGKNISVRFLIDKTRSGVIASSSNRWITEMLQLMHLRWTQPRIDEKQFNLVKNKNINQIMESKRSAEDLFKEEVAIALQGNNYVTKTITEASIFENLQQDSIIPVFNQCFGNATDYCFIVVSSLPLSLLEPDLIKYIGALPFGKVRQDYQFKRYDFPEDSFTIESFSSDSPKGSVSLIYNQNRLPFELTEFNIKADIMKSVLRTRLLAELREKMGKVYSVGVAASGTVLPDTLCRETITFSCDPEDKDILTEKVAAVINEMIAEPQSMSNIITDVKKNMVKTHLAEKQKSSFWSSSIRNAICFNYKNWDSVNNYEAMVEKISIEDIAEMMKHCFIESPCIKTYLLPKN